MNVKPLSNYGIVVVENTYDDIEQQRIWEDIEIIKEKNLMKSPKDTGGAKNYFTGNYIKNNYGTYLNSLHNTGVIKNILPLSEKIFSHPAIIEAVISLGPIYELYKLINNSGNLISYYENSDFYEPHIDQSVFTVLTWWYQKPKSWDGGILKFTDKNLEVEPLYNRSIIFPSCFRHEVSPVVMQNDSKSGRYTISHFGFITPKT